MTRRLVVNADDFGLTSGVNRGTVDAHLRGSVTSATMMVRATAAEEAAELAHSHPDLAVGLHVDLGEWAFRDGEWKALYESLTPTTAMLSSVRSSCSWRGSRRCSAGRRPT